MYYLESLESILRIEREVLYPVHLIGEDWNAVVEGDGAQVDEVDFNPFPGANKVCLCS